MPSKITQLTEAEEYEYAARAYERSLIPEKHLMESTAQATQRKITLESLDLVNAKRPEVQIFNELLVQYQFRKDRTVESVVPDNMVVVCETPLQVSGVFVVKVQPAKPYCMLEYVSKSNSRKDYEKNFTRYERELKVPYYLRFYPDNQELSLFRLREGRYQSVLPNKRERLAIPKLELEVAILDGWVRYWFRGELLLLPAELDREREAEKQRATEATQRATAAEAKAEKDRKALQDAQEELTRLRAQLGRAR